MAWRGVAIGLGRKEGRKQDGTLGGVVWCRDTDPLTSVRPIH